MKAVHALPNTVDAIQKQFFSMIHKSKNIEYELISRLGKSMLIIYQSSSEVERDFSVQHALAEKVQCRAEE